VLYVTSGAFTLIRSDPFGSPFGFVRVSLGTDPNEGKTRHLGVGISGIIKINMLLSLIDYWIQFGWIMNGLKTSTRSEQIRTRSERDPNETRTVRIYVSKTFLAILSRGECH
jgi:hypothetical protein